MTSLKYSQTLDINHVNTDIFSDRSQNQCILIVYILSPVQYELQTEDRIGFDQGGPPLAHQPPVIDLN